MQMHMLLWTLEMPPVAFCGAFRSSQSTAEGALMGLQPCMQGVRGLVHDAEQMDAKQPSVLEK